MLGCPAAPAQSQLSVTEPHSLQKRRVNGWVQQVEQVCDCNAFEQA